MIALLRKMMPFLAVATLGVVLYDGWIFYSRWSEQREGERQEKAAEAERARQTIDMLGGGSLRILNFYASPGEIQKGEHANICYGVYGAQAVRIEPLSEALHPAVSYCLQVAPTADTSYTLVAEDGKGHSVKQTFEVRVRR